MECLDEDAVLAFVDGRLGAADCVRISAHLAQCPSCADLVATSAGGEPAPLSALGLGEALARDALDRGDTVGRYVILGLVGRGGMGEVYAAYDPQLDRRIALKLLHETALGGTADRIARGRLLREAKAIARLSHPNVVVVHDAGAIADPTGGERVFLAMEFVEGATLSDWLSAETRSWRAVRDVFLAAGEGLAAAHEAGLVHRDFKPQNVMVARDGAVRVMDFGLASDVSEVASGHEPPLDLTGAGEPTSHTLALTRTGVLLGTPLYMAPEQFLGRATDARSDQFSFCVALYEALYGERPFPSESLSLLVDAVINGKVREPAQRGRVPSFLRRLLLRGLAPDPASRFPSMRALLDQLRTDPGRRRRTVLVAAAVAVAAVGVAAGTQRAMTRGERMCSGAADKLAGIWELGDGPRRSAIHQAFLATGRGFAEETWTRVSGLLDDYSRRWTGLYTDNCQATHVRGDQSTEVLDLRTSCLEGPRGALRALTDVLVHADGAVLVEAVNAARALPELDRCSDVAALRAVVPPPADAQTRARVTALETRLAEVKALRDTGQWKAALAQARTLADAVRAVGYEPLLADILATQSWLEHESGDSLAADKTLEEAVWIALAAHRDDIAAEDAAQLVGINGYFLANRNEANRWDRVADALLRRLGPGHDRLAGWLQQNRATTDERAGDHGKAAREFDLALALKRKALPANDPDIARTYYSIVNNDIALKDASGALGAAEQALAIYRADYGSASPLLWVVLADRGEAFELLGRYAEAESDFRSALEKVEGLLGGEHVWTAIALSDLGKVLLDQKKAQQAIPFLERALRIRERSEPSLENVAETRFTLGRALWEAGEDRSRALTLAASARDTYRKLPRHETEAAEADAWLTGVAKSPK